MEQLLGQGDFQKQFEDIMKEMSQEMGGANPLDAAGGPLPEHHHPHEKSGEALAEHHHAKSESKEKEAAPTTQAEKEKAAKAEKSFQDTIKKTMERMQSSSDTATSAAASSSQDDMLAQMLASMESGGFGGEGGDEDFSKILMGMMEQLTNKDILYEPMKELDDKFPKWMENNKDKVDKADLKRYEEQQTLVREIVSRFEKKGYSDSNAQDREYIVERMQKVCIVTAASTMDKHVTNTTIDASRGLSTT
jgi:peroxin-19